MMQKCLAGLFGILSVIACAEVLYAATVTIQPGLGDGYDTYIYHNGASLDYQNYGENDGLSVVNSTSHRAHTLIKFDISSITASYVESAALSLYVNRKDITTAVNVYRITSDWDEMSITYNNSTVTRTTSDDVAVTIADGYVGWVEWDVTDYVNAWLSGETNYGLYILDSHNVYLNQTRFISSDDETVDSLLYPKLTLTTSAIPEPASLLLIGSALVSLFFKRRK